MKLSVEHETIEIFTHTKDFHVYIIYILAVKFDA
jgi:hypothetical protein